MLGAKGQECGDQTGKFCLLRPG